MGEDRTERNGSEWKKWRESCKETMKGGNNKRNKKEKGKENSNERGTKGTVGREKLNGRRDK